MDLELFKICINAGLFVLIWIVQLVVYPGFCYFSEADIKRWHPLYTFRISLIVLPLMVSQLALYIISAYQDPGSLSIGILLLVIVVWLITFLRAVPLHNAIDKRSETMAPRKQLVEVNWYRTTAWTIIFIISLVTYGK